MYNGRKQFIPRITPAMLKHNPDQVSMTLNRLIDTVNYLESLDLENLINSYSEDPEPTPPAKDWHQVLGFDPTKMGTTPGWCLQNCRLGFGIATGQFPSARADMESQQANGTLHAETPFDYLQVPVYVETGIPEGHVVVWDKGTVWSDGVIVPDGLSHYSHVYGWGELCDGRRVVTRDAE